MKFKVSFIQASSMGYAIAYLLLIGMLCSGVLFISSINSRLKILFELEEHMLFNNYLSLKYGANMKELYSNKIVHHSGDTTILSKKQWGGFEVITAQTIHSGRKIVKSAFIGSKPSDDLIALYLPDYNQTVKLCGNTKIEGTVFTSSRGFERGHLSGAPYSGDQLNYGERFLSKKSLPPLNTSLSSTFLTELINQAKELKHISKDSTFLFTNETSILKSANFLSINGDYSGNIIFHAMDSLVVESTAKLKNVLIVAPVIRFKGGFQGAVQAFATNKIICEENVNLRYPSSLVLNESDLSLSTHINQSFIELRQGASVIGGVLLSSNNPNFRNPVRLIVDQALIGGLVYNQGETELKGEIIGSLYTSRLSLNYGGGSYSGHLLNAKISSLKLPKEFIMPDWLESELLPSKRIVSCF